MRVCIVGGSGKLGVYMIGHKIKEWCADLGIGVSTYHALPLELRPRADEILTRQLEAAQEIARRLTRNRQQFAVTTRIETGEAVKRPVYVDRAM